MKFHDHDKIEALIRSGLIANHIAEQIGCNPETVRNVAKARGLTLTTRVSKNQKSRNSGPRPKARRFDYEIIKQMLDQGMSKKDVRLKLGISLGALRYVLETNGWQPKCIKDGCLERRWLNSKRCPEHSNIFRVESNRDKVASWRKRNLGYARQRVTGFTVEMFSECLDIQENKCGLCFTDLESLTSPQVCADHVPDSNPPKPRGILCQKCNNIWLGRLERSEINGDCKITNPQLIQWQNFPPMSRSSFARELGWTQPGDNTDGTTLVNETTNYLAGMSV
jgi:hypothetical protein